MKRRVFLGFTLGALSLPVLARQGRLYGVPQSVGGVVPVAQHDRLKLELARATVPADLWDGLARLGAFWEDVLGDEKKARQFHRDPAALLERHGLEGVLEVDDAEVRLLRVVADPQLRRLAQDGSYDQFLQAIAGHGLLSLRSRSALEDRIADILSRDLDGLRLTFSRLNGRLDEDALLRAMDGEPFAKIALAVAGEQGGTQSVIAAAALVVIAVGVIVYVSIGIAVTLGITVATSISAAFSVGVMVSGPCEPECHFPEAVRNAQSSLEAGTAAQAPGDLRALLAGFSQVDPGGHEDLRRVSRMAMLLGNKSFPAEALRRLLADEVDALFGACRRLGLLSWREQTYELVVESAKALAYKSVGMPDSGTGGIALGGGRSPAPAG